MLLALGQAATAQSSATQSSATKSLATKSSAAPQGAGQSAPTKPRPKPHAPARHTPHTAATGKVPVVKPRHVGPARHAGAATMRARLAKKEPPKPVEAPKPPPKPAPAPPVPANIGRNTGLPLPRYASLKSDDVNMRVGPAERYPVLWTYKRRDLPVKIEREWDIWRLVEDMDGIKGWVHQATLTGRRSFVITGTENRTLRADASDTADSVAVLKPGVVGRIRSCEAGKIWCQVQVQDYRGWLKRDDFWGADSEEAIAP
jgi:SH3-like domain-containing protein